jgi:ribokinase
MASRSVPPEGGVVSVLGDVAVDLSLWVPSLPREGGDAFSTSRRIGLGGCGGNISIVLARLGVRPRLIANVGEDEWGRAAIASLIQQGVDVSGVSRDRAAPTHLAVVIVSDRGERTMVGDRGASARIGRWSAARLCGSARALVISGYALLGDVRATQAEQAAAFAAKAGMAVVLDLPIDLPAAALPCALRVVDRATIVVGDSAQLCGLARTADPVDAAGRLASASRTVVVTNGAGGCLAIGPTGRAQADGMLVGSVDTTGAGDAFTAALVAGWLDLLPLPEMLALANGFGAAATLRQGAGESLPFPDEVLELLGRAGHLPAGTATWLRKASRFRPGSQHWA